MAYCQDLDTGSEFLFGESPRWTEEEVTLAFGETLIQFLDSLIEPVVPEGAHAFIADLDAEQDGEVSHFSQAQSSSDEK